MEPFDSIAKALQNGDMDVTCTAVQAGLDDGIPAGELLEQGLMAGMNVVGILFKTGKVYIPEVLRSARAMNAALEILDPFLAQGTSHSRGTVLIGTVQGDMHNIGKSLASIMFRGAGFDVRDLGVNVPTERFIAEIHKAPPQVVGLSAMLTTTMLNMVPVVDRIKQEFPSIPVVIGGAPTSQDFALSIGADCWARSAMEGVEKVLAILKNRRVNA